MTVLPDAVERYLARKATAGPWRLAGETGGRFSGAVVIPSLAEGDSLFKTLQSLSANPSPWTERFLVLVVINQGALGTARQRRQNDLDLERLADPGLFPNLRLAWVDAASPGFEVPARRAGVGFARKLGMDQALLQLDWSGDPLLVCLDADTLVEGGYLRAIEDHFRQSERGAAVLPFRHQAATTPVRQKAIDRYELFLRSYVYGLHLAGSPYAFHSVGSAMACRASAYVRCGGMTCRQAGEDFYFLQKLAKTDGVERLSGTTVFPAARPSTRVPFGTGRSMIRLLAGDKRAVLFYPVAVFEVLAAWLNAAVNNLSASAEELFREAESISPVLSGYLVQADWRTVWPRLQTNHQNMGKRLQAFHAWFDGFRTLRLIHLLCDEEYVRGEPQEILPEYFSLGKRCCPRSTTEMLESLRHWEESLPG